MLAPLDIRAARCWRRSIFISFVSCGLGGATAVGRRLKSAVSPISRPAVIFPRSLALSLSVASARSPGPESLPSILSRAAGSSAQGWGRGDAMADLPMYVGSRITLARGADRVT
eukprot:976739-Alexandrium_andersonii.AAC.1